MWSFLVLAKQTIRANKSAAYQFILIIRLGQFLLSVTLVRDTECVTLSIHSALIRRTFGVGNHVILIKVATTSGFIRPNVNLFVMS